MARTGSGQRSAPISGLLVTTPWPPLLVLAATGGYIYFSDFKPRRNRILAGGLHAAAQMATAIASTVLLARYARGAECNALLILYTAVIGGILASTVMGAYLLICLNCFGRHWNEAFSSLRIAGYKNFLRLKIAADGELMVFPIGLTDVPRDDIDPPRNPELHPHLIEGPLHIS